VGIESKLNRRSIERIAVALVVMAFAWIRIPAWASEDSLRQDVLTTWTTDQGLPQNFVRAITQTTDGFLWVGTMNGLVRFDGLRFRGFSETGPSELRENISDLEPDSGDGLWIATASGLIHYAHQRFQALPLAGQLHYRIDAMARGRDGEVWIYSDGKLARTQRDILQIRSIPAVALRLQDIAESADRTLWIADGESMFAMRGDAKPVRYPLPGVRMVQTDTFGDVFAGDGHRLFRFDGERFAPVSNPGLGNFVSVMVDHQRRLWMASGGLHGLSRKSGDKVETLTAEEGLASDDVRLIFEDRNHDIWLGTISGLQRLHRGVFVTDTTLDGLLNSHNQLDAVFEQRDGTIWAGSTEGGVAALRSGNWRGYGRSRGLSPGQVRGFAEDGDKPSVAVSDYGIFSYRSGVFARMTSIPPGYISTPVKTQDGSLWFSVQHRGLFRRKDAVVTHFGVADGLPEGPIWSLTVDANGVLWVGGGNQLLRWNEARFEKALDSPSPVLCVAWSRSGALVSGTLNGLLIRTSHATRTLSESEGLPGETVLDVIEDSSENLWIATTRAIARLPKTQWAAFAEGKINRVQPEIFTQSDGLKSNSVLPLNEVTALRSRDGRIWFSTPRGLSVADPNLAPELAVRASIDSVLIDDQEQRGWDIAVAPGQHRITFVYTTPPAVAAEQIRFRYRLSGWDKGWIDADTARQVSYTALPPGSYTFEVIAINREGVAGEAPAAITVHLKPFFWQTRWFIALVISTAAWILVEVTRRRTHLRAERLNLRFQERAAERERIAYQIHDTVIQDMIGTALQLELLGFQMSDDPERARTLLASLTHRLRETIARSRNMVGSLHSTAVVQYSLVEMLRNAEAEFRLGDLPAFELTSEGEPRQVHPLVRDEVYRICREAVANAFRHSDANHVRIKVRFLREALEVEISDDGKGMDEETRIHGRPGHFGLSGMRAHASRVGAHIVMQSRPGEGTRVMLRVSTQRQVWPWRKARQNNLDEKQAG
jgi:signal transduction histidine kinase/ligand-binding sensor domain-containing protein